jgi:trehalose 6-phosphate phosphatase
VVHRAKRSVELHPPIEADKGTAVRALAAGLDAVIFLGDDVGDLPAFAALSALRAEGRHTVKVAVTSAEASEEMLAAADIVVDGPEGALAVLRRLAG